MQLIDHSSILIGQGDHGIFPDIGAVCAYRHDVGGRGAVRLFLLPVVEDEDFVSTFLRIGIVDRECFQGAICVSDGGGSAGCLGGGKAYIPRLTAVQAGLRRQPDADSTPEGEEEDGEEEFGQYQS